ncbi:MAG TPA: 3'-5' exonuclease [Polyangiaceae bacterium]|nr:3'-5' exonuclease [Polyangiaceae bacterium]
MKSTTDGCGCFPTGRHYPGIAHLLRVHVAGVADELAADAPWEGQRIAFLDTETTGRDSATDRILEVGIIIGEGGRVLERYNWLVNPGVPIPEAVSKIHGITDEAVRDKPPLAAVAPEIVAALRGAIPAAYNASFDRAFLRAEMARAGALAPAAGTRAPPALREGIEWIDPLVWARFLQREERSKTLSEVAARLGIKLENAHRASDDAEAALLVMYALGRDERVPRAYGQLIREQRRLARMQEEDFAKWRR